MQEPQHAWVTGGGSGIGAAIAEALVGPGCASPLRGDAAMVKTLQDFVKQSIAPYKYPRAIEFVDQLPRTQSGKLQRFRLRET